MKLAFEYYQKMPKRILSIASASALLLCSATSFAADTAGEPSVKLLDEIEISTQALYFNGKKVSPSGKPSEAQGSDTSATGEYNYAYGRAITPHGDAIKVYKDYVFMTWYRGGKLDRHVMLTRYNMKTGEQVTIEFPHQHTGFEGRWWHGETHNTIAVAISPKDETIHLLYDMHAYRAGTDSGGNGSFQKDYFRYSYSVPGAATVADNDFTLAKFVKDTSAHSEGVDDYKHLSMNGVETRADYERLTYPSFFQNDQGDLFMHMRQGTSYDGRIVFNKYLPEQKKWTAMQGFNSLVADDPKHGDRADVKEWSIYGFMKFKGGKMRVGFQKRHNLPDKYKYQNGVYYAYSDDPTGASQWKNYKGELLAMPVVKAEEVLVFEPGDLEQIKTTKKDQVYIVGGFDWTATDNGDVHIISRVEDRENKITVNTHSYQKGGVGEFVTSTDFAGAEEIYAAGENVYLIGLKNGRPYVQKTKGGTNNFEVVYAPTTGKTFEKGVVYLYQGKLYYYLLEEHDAPKPDTRTTYLQIIDLGIQPQGPAGYQYAVKAGETVEVTGTMNVAFGADGNFTYLTNQTENVTCDAATFKAPVSDEEQACFTLDVMPTIAFVDSELALTEGYDALSIVVNASTPVADRTIDVALSIGGTDVSTDTETPFEWTQTSEALKSLTVGTYSVKAIVTDSTGLKAEATMNIVVSPKAPPAISFVESELVLLEEYEDITVTVTAETSAATQDIANVALYIGDTLVSEDNEAPYEWTKSSAQLLDLAVGTHTLKAVLTDVKNANTEATMTVTVNAKVTPKIVFANLASAITEGDNITVTVNAQTAENTRAINNVALYINNQLVSKDDVAPYQWTQTSAPLANLVAGSYTLKAVLTDTSGATSEVEKSLTVKTKPQPEEPKKSSSSGGGGSTSVFAFAALALVALRRRYC